MNKNTLLILSGLTMAGNMSAAKPAKKSCPQKPNIIYILADDLGYGDLSCYGQQKFSTPNIDKLAQKGIKFTQHYSGSAVSAPSRCTLMTGMHTGHAYIRGNKELKGQEGQTPMPADTYTIAEMLKSAGYTTGAFGKWGLGFPGSEGDPNMQGFDTFFGYNCQRMAHRYYPPYLWENQHKVTLPGNNWTNTVTYAPDVIQEHTLKFIEDNKNRPFFAYVPIIQPHAELIAPDDSILAKFLGKYPERPFIAESGGDYGANIDLMKYASQKTPHAVFAAMIYRVDVYVGQIMAKLEELGIADNTIVMFSSDNGPHVEGGAEPAFFNSAGGLKGVKRDLYEGGIRNVFVAQWPKHIKAGTVTNHPSAFWDVMPTCADIAGVKLTNKIDGISFLPTLTSKGKQAKHEYMYWELQTSGGRVAVRMGDWKGVLYKSDKNTLKDLELYNLATDVNESKNIAKENPQIVAKIQQIIKKEHVDSEMFPINIKE